MRRGLSSDPLVNWRDRALVITRLPDSELALPFVSQRGGLTAVKVIFFLDAKVDGSAIRL